MEHVADELSEAGLRAALEVFARGYRAPVVVLGETGSTNDDAKRLGSEGAPHGTIVVADAQTAGRGRAGHVWHSPPGDNVYLSVLLRPGIPPAKASSFTLVVGLCVAEAIEARIPATARVKWPNDVFVDGRKIAGVLVEGQVRGDTLASLVVGVGVNVLTRAFPPPLDARATSLALLGARDLRRCRLAAELSARIVASSAVFADRGLAPFLERLEARDGLRGRRVEVGDVRGEAVGLDLDGSLLVRDDEGRTCKVASGEVVDVG